MTVETSAVVGAVSRPESSDDSRRLREAVRIALVAASAIVVSSQAWIGDDALISIRAIANTLRGNGATFNVLERVQVYTSPLWFWLQVAANWVHFDPLVWAMVLGIVCTVIFSAMLVWSTRSVALAAAVVFSLISSPAFVEWGTSGLENSLGYVLIGGLALAAGRYVRAPGRARAVLLGVALALVGLTRHDLLLLGAPIALGALLTRRDGRHAIAALAAAAIPVVAWSALALFYYGFVLPNTAYAKLNVEIPLVERVARGLNYLRMFLLREPQAVLPLTLALVAAYVAASRGRWHVVGSGVGIGIYLAYVVVIGGDFMEGRFLAVPLALSAVVVGTMEWRVAGLGGQPSRLLAAGLASGVALAVAAGGSTPWHLSSANGPPLEYRASGRGGVADERGIWVARNRSLWVLVDMLGGQAGVIDADDAHLVRFRRLLAAWPAVDPDTVSRLVEKCGELGRVGIVEGPAVHVLDICALTDPVLARVPFRASGFHWRPGHYPRAVPQGYPAAVLSGDAGSIVDPAIRRLFDEVASRTRRHRAAR